MPASPISETDFAHVLAHTADLWPDLRNANIFITGGTGFIGKWLLETLQAANKAHALGARVTVLTRDAARFRAQFPWIAEAPGTDLLEGDVRSFSFPDGRFSHIIHAASDMDITAPPLQVHDVIVGGTKRILDFAAERAIRDVLLVSSGAVYGPQPAAVERMGEDFAGAPPLAQPATAYGQGKRDAEWLAHAYSEAHGLRCRIARLFTFTGPYLPSNYAAASFVGDLLARRPINVAGDGTAVRSYLHAGDMAIWLWTALLRGQAGLVCNVGGEEAITMSELAALVAGLASPALPVHIAHSAAPSRAASRYLPSTALARRVLGLAPRVMLEESLRRMIFSRTGSIRGL